MKKSRAIPLFLFTLIVGSCELPVQFKEPQPTGEKNIYSFPPKLHANYLNEDDSSILTINDSIIVRHYNYRMHQSKTDLDSTYQLVNDSMMVNRETQRQFKVSVRDDTIMGNIETDDTVFRISETNILRRFKGYYFLNMEYSASWEVQLLGMSNGKLTLASIDSKSGMEKIKNISPLAKDSTSGDFDLSQQEFKEFIHENGFSKQEEFVRIKTIK